MAKIDQVTQWALRAGLSKVSDLALGDDGNQSTIADSVMGHASRALDGRFDATKITSILGKQQTIVAAAAVTVGAAFIAAKWHADHVEDVRQAFSKNFQAGLGSFSMPKDFVPPAEYAFPVNENEIMHRFFETFMSQPLVAGRIGLKTIDAGAQKIHIILPLFRTTQNMSPVNEDDDTILAEKRDSITLFIRTITENMIALNGADFSDDSSIEAWVVSLFKNKRYLKDLEWSIWISMALGNLLWNLQHLVDPDSGLPLSDSECADICEAASLALKEFLLKAYPENTQNEITKYVKSVIEHVETLQAAYTHASQHTVDFEDLMTNAQRVLYTMNETLFALVYRKARQHGSQLLLVDRAAESIVYHVRSMSTILHKQAERDNRKILELCHTAQAKMPVLPFINKPPRTIIDILAMACWLPDNDLEDLVDVLREQQQGPFADLLHDFSRDFIHSIRHRLPKGFGEKGREAVYRILPLFTLLLKNYHFGLLNNDIESQKQAVAINQMAVNENTYIWSLAPFLSKRSSVIPGNIDQLFKGEYRMSLIRQLLYTIKDIQENYGTFLQDTDFQAFLLECINKVQDEYEAFEQGIQTVRSSLNQGNMSLNLQVELGSMLRDLRPILSNFASMSHRIASHLRAPGFTEEKKKELNLKLNNLASQYQELYGANTALTAMVQNTAANQLFFTDNMRQAAQTQGTSLNDRFLATYRMIAVCEGALSHGSKVGNKGDLLRSLRQYMDRHKATITDEKLNEILLAQARIVLSYRQELNWVSFVHSGYSRTNSARAFAKLLKDTEINTHLPLGQILFGDDTIRLTQETEDTILTRLASLGQTRHWEHCEMDIQFASLLMPDNISGSNGDIPVRQATLPSLLSFSVFPVETGNTDSQHMRDVQISNRT